MATGMFVRRTFIGCMRFSVKSCLKYLAIIVALMDNFNQGTGEFLRLREEDDDEFVVATITL